MDLKVFAGKLRALQYKQDAFTILSRSLANKIPHFHLAWPLVVPPEEAVRLSMNIDAVTLRELASLAETSSLPPSAAEIASLPVLDSDIGLPTGPARFLAAALAFSGSYVMGIADDDQCSPPENEYYAANVDGIAASLEDEFPGVKQVRSSPVVGRLSERLICVIDVE